MIELWLIKDVTTSIWQGAGDLLADRVEAMYPSLSTIHRKENACGIFLSNGVIMKNKNIGITANL